MAYILTFDDGRYVRSFEMLDEINVEVDYCENEEEACRLSHEETAGFVSGLIGCKVEEV